MNNKDIILASSISDNAAADAMAAIEFDERNKLIRSKTAVILKEELEYPFYKDGKSNSYFYSDKILISDKHTTSIIKYAHIVKVYETGEYFFIYVTQHKIFAILKKGFTRADDIESVRKLLKINVKDKFEKV